MNYIIWIVFWGIAAVVFTVLDTSWVNAILRNLWFIAFAFLSLSLLVTPIVTLTNKQELRPYRKVFWVLAFFLWLAHSGKYFYDEFAYSGKIFIFEHFYEKDVFTWVIAVIIITLLGITSFNFLHKKMGKYWQQLHSLVYPLFCIVALHIAFASRFDLKYMSLISLVVLVRYIAYQKTSNQAVSTTGKYICIPSGYVYDPAVGDPDSGIASGTKFEDIPEWWVCPVCGVSKADFVPFSGDEASLVQAQVVKLKMLTPSVLELTLETQKEVSVTPWQFAKIRMHDAQGDFARSYSVVSHEGVYITFAIKLWEWRGSWVLKTLKGGESLKLEWVFWNFTLKNTANKKVFIATGTGVAPIVHMLASKKLVWAELFFGVATKSELFYEDKIREIEGLTTHTYLSQETIEWYEHGRIDLSKYSFTPETEFYICGNPAMVETVSQYLQEHKFTNIITEKFS